MNTVIIGANQQPLSRYIPTGNFLLIDDGPIIDTISVRARRFDLDKHAINFVKDTTYLERVSFTDVLKAAFPEGEDTLTKATFEYQVLEALARHPRTLDRLIPDTKDTQYAYQKVQRLLMSPVLERVLNRGTNFSLKGTITVRLDRAALGDFDCFVLGNLLASRYEGTVIVPDFGFYACPIYRTIIRQDRLIAGIRSFDEVPAFRHQLVQIPEKVGSRCTPQDADILAQYAGLVPGTNGHTSFVENAIA